MGNETKLDVLLLGNYEKDGLESMQRFATVLLQQSPAFKITAELIQPTVRLGRILKSNHGLGKWAGYFDKYFLFPIELRKRISCPPIPRLVHICDHANAVYSRQLQEVPHLATCHDLLAIRSAKGEIPENPTRWSGQQLQRFILNGLNKTQHVACVSEATRRDLLRISSLKPAQVNLIPMGLNYDYSPMEKNKARGILETISESRGIDSPPVPFIFHVGGNQWYKNRLGVLQIFEALSRSVSQVPLLIMAGKPFTAEMIQFIDEKKLREKVVSVENCTNEELRALYSTAELLLFPSLQEGFGWPIIEAQASGCRVLTTRKPPMTEVGGDAAFYFTAGQYEDAAKTMQTILNQTPAEKNERIRMGFENAARFSTTRMIEQYVALYGKVSGLTKS